ncbi:MAG: hypothetical protein ABSC08_16400 [Bryobacteraceae bacterium]|jgi:hypothetical protein
MPAEYKGAMVLGILVVLSIFPVIGFFVAIRNCSVGPNSAAVGAFFR